MGLHGYTAEVLNPIFSASFHGAGLESDGFMHCVV